MERLQPHDQRHVVTSSCVPWEQSCGRQHVAGLDSLPLGLSEAAHPTMGLLGIPCTQGGPESPVAPPDPGLTPVCPCTAAARLIKPTLNSCCMKTKLFFLGLASLIGSERGLSNTLSRAREELGRGRGLEEQRGGISLSEAMTSNRKNIKNKSVFFSPNKSMLTWQERFQNAIEI